MRRVVSQPRVVFLVLITRRRGKRDSPLVVVTGAFRLFGLIPPTFCQSPWVWTTRIQAASRPFENRPRLLDKLVHIEWPCHNSRILCFLPSRLWLFFLPFLYLPNTGMFLCLFYIPLCLLPPSQNKCNFMIQNLSHRECYFD
jgi:hypothetical protein